MIRLAKGFVMARAKRREIRLRRSAHKRNRRGTLVIAFVLAFAMLAGSAFADLVYNDVDDSIDNEVETLVIAPGDVEIVTLTWINTNTNESVWGLEGSGHDDEEASYVDTVTQCNLRSDLFADVSVTNTNAAVAAVTSDDLEDGKIRFEDCGDEIELTVTGVAAGTTEVRFAIAAGSTAEGANFTAPANFDVQVVSPDPGRAAPAIANEYLRTHTDADFLASCKGANGTNRNKSNWHGQLITKVADQFEGQTFARGSEGPVMDYVDSLCE
jgi:hypothetical protein